MSLATLEGRAPAQRISVEELTSSTTARTVRQPPLNLARAIAISTTPLSRPTIATQYLTVTKPVAAPIAILPSKETVPSFASLSPRARFRWLAKNQPGELLMSLLGAVGGVYLVGSALLQLIPFLDTFISMSAQAQGSVPEPVFRTSRDMFDWYVGGLMGVGLLVSLGITIFAQNDSKISFGKDTTKIIVGFTVGFLSGGKS